MSNSRRQGTTRVMASVRLEKALIELMDYHIDKLAYNRTDIIARLLQEYYRGNLICPNLPKVPKIVIARANKIEDH